MKTVFGSMQPEEQAREEREALAEKKEKERLEKQAGLLGVVNSEATKVLVGIIRKQLIGRVEALVKGDGEANAYIKTLNELGIKEGAALNAAKELQEKYFKIKE